MKQTVHALVAGAAGALSVTLLHELIRKSYSGAPRLDLLGEEAFQKTADALGTSAPSGKSLYGSTMAADLLSNTIYYSGAGFLNQSPILAGTGLGLAAGLGAVTLPEKMNLDGSTTASTAERQWITVGLYTFGGLISGLVLRHLRK